MPRVYKGKPNVYHDRNAKTEPLSTLEFEGLVRRQARLLGLPLATSDEVDLVRYLLFRTRKNASLQQIALQEVLEHCFTYLPYVIEVVKTAGDTYAQSIFAPMPEAREEEMAEKLGIFLKGENSDRKRDYKDAKSIEQMAVMIAAVKEYYDVTPQWLLENTRGQSNTIPDERAPTVLRAGLSIRLRREAKDIFVIFRDYLCTKEHFENPAGLQTMLEFERTRRMSHTFGSFGNRGYQLTEEARDLEGWKERLLDEVQGVNASNIVGLLSRPGTSEQDAELRARFWAALRDMARESGYSRKQMSKFGFRIYRAYDLHMGRTHGRVLTELEKEAILWWVGQVDQRPLGIVLASDALSLPHAKVSLYVYGLGLGWEARVNAVIMHFGDEEPEAE